MDPDRFDRVARTLAAPRSRRAAVKGGVLGFGAVAFGIASRHSAGAAAQDATPAPAGELAADGSALFVQTATGGTFLPNPDAGVASPAAGAAAGDYVLTLDGHAGQTIAFADRPSRNFAEVPTDGFLSGLGFPTSDPPNAAIVTDDDVLLVELFSPAYDADSGTLTYGASVLSSYEGEGLAPVAARQRDQELAAEFGAASLFIDDCSNGKASCSTSDNCWGNISYGNCWSWSNFGCYACDSSYTLSAQCNATFSGCNGQCVAQTDVTCNVG